MISNCNGETEFEALLSFLQDSGIKAETIKRLKGDKVISHRKCRNVVTFRPTVLHYVYTAIHHKLAGVVYFKAKMYRLCC